jgi:hypothetical protein
MCHASNSAITCSLHRSLRLARSHERQWRRRDTRATRRNERDSLARIAHEPLPRVNARSTPPRWLTLQRKGPGATSSNVPASKPGRTPGNSARSSPGVAPRTSEPSRADELFVRWSTYSRRAAFRLSPDAPRQTRDRPPKLTLSSSTANGHNKRYAVIDLNRARVHTDPALGTNKSRNKLAHALNGNTNDHQNTPPTPPTAPHRRSVTPTSPQTDTPTGRRPPRLEPQTRTGLAVALHNDRVLDVVDSSTPGSQQSDPGNRWASENWRPIDVPDSPPPPSTVTHDPHAAPPTTTASQTTSPSLTDSGALTSPMRRLRLTDPRQPRPAATQESDSNPPSTVTTQHGVSAASPPTATPALVTGAPSDDVIFDRSAPRTTQPTPDLANPGDVPSAGGGLAERCAHWRCDQEVWACCVARGCARPLCGLHFGPTTMTPPLAPSRCHEHGRSRDACPCQECVLLRRHRPRTQAHTGATPPTTVPTPLPIIVVDAPSVATSAAVTDGTVAPTPADPRGPSRRELTAAELARIAAHRQQALARRRELSQQPPPLSLTAEDLQRIAANRSEALARKRQLQNAQAEPRNLRPRATETACPGLNLPAGWRPSHWTPPQVPADPVDYRTGPIPEVARSCVTRECVVQLAGR